MNPRRRRIRRKARAERKLLAARGHSCEGRDPLYGRTVRVLESRVSESCVDPPAPLEPGLYRVCHAYPTPAGPEQWVQMRPIGAACAHWVRIEVL